MNPENRLAVVIPVYRAHFFRDTLASLAAQTDKRFNVYIGNDGSDENIELIVNDFITELNIRYKYFPDNLGKTSLVSHWQRCIDIVSDEDWIWILPDDDKASPDCVSIFHDAIRENDTPLLYRFQTEHIDGNGNFIKDTQICPPEETNVDFVLGKLRFERNSSIAEYIFSKKEFIKIGGFIDLPLAWGSDDLLWIMLSQENDIITLPGGKLSLRQSIYNISGDSGSYEKEKFTAKYRFLKLLTENQPFMNKLQEKHTKAEFNRALSDHLFYEYKSYRLKFSFGQILKYAALNNNIIGGGFLKNIYRLLRIKNNHER